MSIAVRKYFSSGANALAGIYKAIPQTGWQIWDEVSSTNKVYRSNGEDGIYPYVYARIYYSSYIYLELYLYWDNVTHTGTTKAYGSSGIEYTSGYYNIAGNKDAFGVMQSYYKVIIGFCNKLFYPTITNLTSSASLGDNVNLEVTSSSGIVKGQRIQIVGVNTEGRDQLQVTVIPDSTHITVLNLPRDYASGAFLGVTPCPAAICTWTDTISWNPVCPRNAVGTANVSVGGAAILPINESYADPEYASYYYLFYPVIVAFHVSYVGDSLVGYLYNDFFKFGYYNQGATTGTFFYNNAGWPEQGVVTAATSTTISDSSKSWVVNEWVGYHVLIADGIGLDQARVIASNTANTLTLSLDALETIPDNTSTYRIVEKVYRFGGSASLFLEETNSISLSSSSSSSSSMSSSSSSSSSVSSSSSFSTTP